MSYLLKTGLVGLLVLAVLMLVFLKLMHSLDADDGRLVLVALAGWKVSDIAIGVSRMIVRRPE